MSDLKSYFDRFSRVNPDWDVFVRKCTEKHTIPDPGFKEEYLSTYLNEEGVRALTRVNEHNFPKIYKAAVEVAKSKGVPIPAIYANNTKNFTAGLATRDAYTIEIREGFEDRMTLEEMKWLMTHELKHLYQGDNDTFEESCMQEHDSNRAAVAEVGYKTTLSFFHKYIQFVVEEKMPSGKLKNMILKMHERFPNLAAEHFPFSIDYNESDFARLKIVKDKFHPSLRDSMKEMRRHEKQLEEIPQP